MTRELVLLIAGVVLIALSVYLFKGVKYNDDPFDVVRFIASLICLAFGIICFGAAVVPWVESLPSAFEVKK